MWGLISQFLAFVVNLAVTVFVAHGVRGTGGSRLSASAAGGLRQLWFP
jgi:hypothetical protein